VRIVLLTVQDHIYANLIVKRLIDEGKGELTAIVESSVLLHKKSFSKAIWEYLRISGAHYVAAQAIKQESFKILSFLYGLFRIQKPSSLFFSYRGMAKKQGIPIYVTKDINAPDSLEMVKRLKPDLLVSVFFNQIMGKRLLRLARNCINIHPALLPDYKGVSPVFWALANSEPSAGVTIHFVDGGIDTGDILYQKVVPISPDDTEHSLYLKCCEAGTPLLLKALNALESGNANCLANGAAGSYFSLPTKEAVRQFRKAGRRFFRVLNRKRRL